MAKKNQTFNYDDPDMILSTGVHLGVWGIPAGNSLPAIKIDPDKAMELLKNEKIDEAIKKLSRPLTGFKK